MDINFNKIFHSSTILKFRASVHQNTLKEWKQKPYAPKIYLPSI